MELYRKIKKKIKEGFLRELVQEAKWMYTYIRRYRGTVLIHLIFGVAAILMGLGTSVASKYLIDAVTGYETGRIGTAAGCMIGMLIGNLLFSSLNARIGAIINIKVQNEIQAEVYRHILDTDWESLEQYRSGDLMHRLTGDVGTICSGVTGFVPSLISNTVRFVGALLIMLYYDPTMALIALIGIPAAVLCSRSLVRKMRGHNKKMKEISSDVMSFYEDSLSNLTSIKAFDITGDYYHKMTDLQNVYRGEYLSYNQFSVRTSAAVSLMGMLVSAGCFGWGVYRLWSGAISFGSMTLFLQLASALSSAFSALIGMVSTAISISTSAGRIMEIVQMPSEQVDREKDFRGCNDISLRLDGVEFSYQNGEPVLKETDLKAAPGELVVLTGPSGEGKTTLLRMMLGLIRPKNGSAVLCRGEECVPLSSATRTAFAYVPQGNSMFAGTIAEELRLTCPDASDEELWEVLKIACAEDFVRKLPEGMNYRIGGRGKSLSEGQSQRLAVARALLRGAPILLLDEATSALDEQTEQKLLDNLMHCGRVNTCIFATHRPGVMIACDRQYRVEQGKVTRIK